MAKTEKNLVTIFLDLSSKVKVCVFSLKRKSFSLLTKKPSQSCLHNSRVYHESLFPHAQDVGPTMTIYLSLTLSSYDSGNWKIRDWVRTYSVNVARQASALFIEKCLLFLSSIHMFNHSYNTRYLIKFLYIFYSYVLNFSFLCL